MSAFTLIMACPASVVLKLLVLNSTTWFFKESSRYCSSMKFSNFRRISRELNFEFSCRKNSVKGSFSSTLENFVHVNFRVNFLAGYDVSGSTICQIRIKDHLPDRNLRRVHNDLMYRGCLFYT